MDKTQLVAELGFVVAVWQECLVSGTVSVVGVLLLLRWLVEVEAERRGMAVAGSEEVCWLLASGMHAAHSSPRWPTSPIRRERTAY